MARPDPAGGGISETRHESVDAWIQPGSMVLHHGGFLGDNLVLYPYWIPQEPVGERSIMDRYLRGSANLNLPPADAGHKRSP